MLNQVELYKKLIKSPYVVKTIRASCISSYWWCSEKARLTALGVHLDTPIAAAAIGTIIHNDILTARRLTPIEQEFRDAIKPFYTTGTDGQPIISRIYKNTKIQVDGEFLTHGADWWKVTPDRKVWNIEYKTKSSIYIKPVDVSPARFQNKLYCWLHAPIFNFIPFELAGGQIVFVKRVGRKGDFQPVGQTEYIHWTEDAELQLLTEIERILWAWNNPEKQIPPKSWKCLRCPQIYKGKCFFQTGVVWDGK